MKNRFSSYGLLFGCPLDSEESDCHLIELRRLPIQERIEELNKKSPEELLALEEHHKECLRTREEISKIKKP